MARTCDNFGRRNKLDYFDFVQGLRSLILWSQNVLEAHNLKFFMGELEVHAFIAHGSSYASP